MAIAVGPKIVILTRDEYDSLLEDSLVLAALHAGGVDNWDWYSDSIQDHYPEYFEKD